MQLTVYGSLFLATLVVLAVLWRRTPNFATFAIASRRMPTVLLFASIAGTYVGPAFSIGGIEGSSRSGYLTVLTFLPYAIQYLLISHFVAPRLRSHEDAMTLGDIFYKASGRAGQLYAGFFGVSVSLLVCGFLSSSASLLISRLANIPTWAGAFLFVGIAILHTYFGGLRATVLTDGMLFTVFCVLFGAMGLVAASSWDQSMANTMSGLTRMSLDEGGLLVPVLTGLSFLLGEALMPPYTQRILASKDEQQASRMLMWGAVFCVFWLANLAVIGSTGTLITSAPNARDGDLLLSIASRLLGPWSTAVVAIALSAIMMSTLDSILNAGAAIAVNDLLPSTAPGARLRRGRQATLLLAMGGLVVGFWMPEVIPSLLLIYALWAPAMLVPTLAILFPSSAGFGPILLFGGVGIFCASILKLTAILNSDGAVATVGVLSAASALLIHRLFERARRT